MIQMSSKQRTAAILRNMKKTGDQVYDGVNSNQPTLFPGNNYNDAYRKVERQNNVGAGNLEIIDNIELSKRIMLIDHHNYNVPDESASRLLDYIEQQKYDVVDELELEVRLKLTELRKKMKEITQLKMEDYLTEEDYERAILGKKRELVEFSNKVAYIKLIIDTIKHYGKELKELEDYEALMVDKPDFSYNFTNHNPSTAAGRLR